MADFADPAIRYQACQCSAQSTKTVIMYMCGGFAFLEDPGPMLWVTKSTPEARNIAETYLWPFFENTPKLAAQLPRSREKKRKLHVKFSGHYFNITGADATGSLQSLPYRYLLLDEVRQWKKGALEMVGKRTRSFPHNFKQFMISCPDMDSDAMDQAFLAGNQQHWFTTCRNTDCGHEQEIKWGEKKKPGGLKWDTNDVTCPNGRWNFDETVKTLRFECEKCGHQHWDIRPSGSDRKHFSRVGRWVPFNSNAPSDYKSYTWNALLPHYTDWHNQLREFLTALEALANGDFVKLKDHWNETRGLPWADYLRFKKEDDYLKEREVAYLPGDPWPHEVRRFMTVDVQGKGGRHYYVVIRAWGHYGKSRKLHHEKVFTVADIVRLMNEYNVDPRHVGLDSAYSSVEIYKLVVEQGGHWKALRGDDKQFFTHPGGVQSIWARTQADPALGTRDQGRRTIPLWLFSAPATRERLLMMMYGHIGEWQISTNEDAEYKRQVTAWERKYVTEGRDAGAYIWYQKRTDDHYEACERMQIGLAAIAGLFEPAPGAGQLPLEPS